MFLTIFRLFRLELKRLNATIIDAAIKTENGKAFEKHFFSKLNSEI